MLATNSTEKIGRNSIKQNKKPTSERKLPVKAKAVSWALGGFILLINKTPKISGTYLRKVKIQAVIAME